MWIRFWIHLVCKSREGHIGVSVEQIKVYISLEVIIDFPLSYSCGVNWSHLINLLKVVETRETDPIEWP